MGLAVLMLAMAYFDRTTAIICVAVLVILKLVAYMRSSKLTLLYAKDNELFKEFVEKSNISTLKFEPYILAPTPVPQGVLYIMKEVLHDKMGQEEFD